MPPEVAEDFYRHYKIPLVQGLGVIELGLVSLNTDDPRGRWNSVGRPAGGFRIQINDPDADGCGEVAVTAAGYADRPEIAGMGLRPETLASVSLDVLTATLRFPWHDGPLAAGRP